jgi:hypothetical protein
VYANEVTTERLQRIVKEEEQRRGKNSPELVRRRWNGGKLADEDPISLGSVRERSRTGGVEGEEAERR